MPGRSPHGFGRVVAALRHACHGDRHAIDTFLNRPHPMLEGKTPFEVARSGPAGTEAVLNLILKAQAGTAV